MEKPEFLDFKKAAPFVSFSYRTDVPEEILKRIVELDPQTVNYPDADGFSPLAMSVRTNNIAMIKFLLEKGAKKDVKDA